MLNRVIYTITNPSHKNKGRDPLFTKSRRDSNKNRAPTETEPAQPTRGQPPIDRDSTCPSPQPRSPPPTQNLTTDRLLKFFTFSGDRAVSLNDTPSFRGGGYQLKTSQPINAAPNPSAFQPMFQDPPVTIDNTQPLDTLTKPPYTEFVTTSPRPPRRPKKTGTRRACST